MAVAGSIASRPALPAPERILGAEDAHAYRRFLEWSIGHGFKMAIIEVTAPRWRDALVAWTKGAIPRACFAELDQASRRPLSTFLEQACPSPEAASVLLLTGLDDAPDRIKLCARLNIQRDELARDFPLPWVLFVHPATALDLTRHAPDFSDFASLWLRQEKNETTELQSSDRFSVESSPQEVSAMDATEGADSAALLKQAFAAIELSRYDEATDLLARHDLHHPEARSRDAQRIRLEGLLLWLRGRPVEALSCFEEALPRCENTRQRAVLLGDIARIHESKGEVDKALSLFQEELQVYEEFGDRRSRATTLGDIAHIRLNKGEVVEALSLHQEAIRVFEELGDRRLHAIKLGEIARIRVSKGEVDEALSLYQEALQVFEELGDRRSRAVTLGDIALIRVRKGEVDEALSLHQKALQVYEELGDRHSRAVTLGEIARIRVRKGEVDEALSLHQEALQVYEEFGDANGIANACWLIGEIALQRGHFRSALERLAKSYATFLSTDRLDGICVVGTTLGRLLLMEGRTAEGIALLERSREGFERLGRHQAAQKVQALLGSALAKPDAPPEGEAPALPSPSAP